MSWKNGRSWKRWPVCYFGIQVLKVSEVCLSSWVLATAAIGLKTKGKKIVYHIDHIFRWRQHHRHLRQWETPKIGIWQEQQQSLKSPLPSCQCCYKVHTDDQNFTTGHQWGNNYIQDDATVIYLSHSKINVKLDFWPKQLHWQKIQTPFANSRLFILTSITINRKTVGDCTSLACDGEVSLS